MACAGRDRCELGYVPAREVEQIAFDFAKRVFLQPEVLIEHLAEPKHVRKELKDAEAGLERTRKALAKTERAELDLGRKLAAGGVPERVAKRLFGEHEESRQRLTDAIADQARKVTELQAALDGYAGLKALATDLAKFTATAADALDGLGRAERRALIRAATAGGRLVIQELPGYYVTDAAHLPSGRAVKGKGEVADALRTIGGAARLYPPGSTRHKDMGRRRRAWRLDLAGEIDLAKVVERLGALAETMRPRMAKRSYKTPPDHFANSALGVFTPPEGLLAAILAA